MYCPVFLHWSWAPLILLPGSMKLPFVNGDRNACITSVWYRRPSGICFCLVLAVPAACCVEMFLPSVGATLAVAPLLKISWPRFESFTDCREEGGVLNFTFAFSVLSLTPGLILSSYIVLIAKKYKKYFPDNCYCHQNIILVMFGFFL